MSKPCKLALLLAISATVLTGYAHTFTPPHTAPNKTGMSISSESINSEQSSFSDSTNILEQTRRIKSSSGWFEIIELPNQIYAFWEPGHEEQVNSYLILGSERDVLYDTGMGIARIAPAIEELRQAETLPQHELMVINSHAHLDHNGGNTEFDEAWIIENDWAIHKLTEGISNADYDFVVPYWRALRDHPGVNPPSSFDPETFYIPPFPREQIRFLKDGDIVDLGNRQFRVIHTASHSPDGLCLYDEENQILFGGDTYDSYLFGVGELSKLKDDLEKVSDLKIKWHHPSHGTQVFQDVNMQFHLSIINRMIEGDRNESATTYAGQVFTVYELEGIEVWMMKDFLTY